MMLDQTLFRATRTEPSSARLCAGIDESSAPKKTGGK